MPKPRSTEKKLLDVSQHLFRLGNAVSGRRGDGLFSDE